MRRIRIKCKTVPDRRGYRLTAGSPGDTRIAAGKRAPRRAEGRDVVIAGQLKRGYATRGSGSRWCPRPLVRAPEQALIGGGEKNIVRKSQKRTQVPARRRPQIGEPCFAPVVRSQQTVVSGRVQGAG